MPQSTETIHFYQNIPGSAELKQMVQAEHYHRAPDDWDVVLTDVRGSTDAIEAGRYKEVNALGVSSIVVVRNALTQAVGDVRIPFVFGGDGATLLTPRVARASIKRALEELGARAQSAYNLELRMGIVSIAHLSTLGHVVLVAKHELSPEMNIALFSGGGLSAAEGLLKDPEAIGIERVHAASLPQGVNLTGLNCRWEPIASRHGVMLSLIIVARGDRGAVRDTYTEVLATLDELTRSHDPRPISASRLQLARTPQHIHAEVALRAPARDVGKLGAELYRLVAWVSTRGGDMLIRKRWRVPGFDGATYTEEVARHTDYRKFDDALRMTLDLTHAQVEEFQCYLEVAHARGALAYGLHRASGAQITCMIDSYNVQHIHFIDGADGGYALAALGLKAQLKRFEEDARR